MSGSATITELLGAFRRTKIVCTLVSVGVVDVLARAPQTPDAVACALRSSAVSSDATLSMDALTRLMRAAVPLGLLDHHPRDGTFSLTSLSRDYLLSDAPQSMAGYVKHSNATLFPLWTNLESSLASGGPAWRAAFPQVFNTSSEGSISPFDALYATDEKRLAFMNAMHSHAVASAASIAPHLCDIIMETKTKGERISIVDIGGATGALAAAIAHVADNRFKEDGRAQLGSLTIFDLPDVISLVESHFLPRMKMDDRLSTVSGDMFKDEIPSADVYILSRILHDWDDDRCVQILSRLRDSLNRGHVTSTGHGMVIIAEKLMDDDMCGPLEASLQDINMLVQTGGRERSREGFTRLLEMAGFKTSNVGTRLTGAYLDLIWVTMT